MPEHLQGQHGAGQVGSLDLGDVGGQHLVSVSPLRVQPVTLPRPGSASSTRPLLGLSLKSTQLTGLRSPNLQPESGGGRRAGTWEMGVTTS